MRRRSKCTVKRTHDSGSSAKARSTDSRSVPRAKGPVSTLPAIHSIILATATPRRNGETASRSSASTMPRSPNTMAVERRALVAYRSVVVGLLVAAAGCRGCRDKPAPPAPAPPTPKTEAPPPVDTPIEAEESSILPPHVALAVHGSAKIELGPGWGWGIDASALDRDAFLPDAGPTRSSRADAGGPSAAFSLQLSRADGTPVPLKAVTAAVPPSDPELALEGETIAEARWLVAPENTQFAPGKYQLIATLEEPAVADARSSGRTTPGPVRIT